MEPPKSKKVKTSDADTAAPAVTASKKRKIAEITPAPAIEANGGEEAEVDEEAPKAKKTKTSAYDAMEVDLDALDLSPAAKRNAIKRRLAHTNSMHGLNFVHGFFAAKGTKVNPKRYEDFHETSMGIWKKYMDLDYSVFVTNVVTLVETAIGFEDQHFREEEGAKLSKAIAKVKATPKVDAAEPEGQEEEEEVEAPAKPSKKTSAKKAAPSKKSKKEEAEDEEENEEPAPKSKAKATAAKKKPTPEPVKFAKSSKKAAPVIEEEPSKDAEPEDEVILQENDDELPDQEQRYEDADEPVTSQVIDLVNDDDDEEPSQKPQPKKKRSKAI